MKANIASQGLGMAKLLHFTVSNYRSFHEQRFFTFRTDARAGRKAKGTFRYGRERLSTISAFYGANSGGKSNLVNAMAMMRMILRESVRINDGEKLPYQPFALMAGAEHMPQSFEVCYIDDGQQEVRYGFSNTAEAISAEWLFAKPAGARKERPLFLRNRKGIAVSDQLFAEGSGLEGKVNDNRLFLSLVAQLGGTTSKSVMRYFITDFNIISGLDAGGYESFTQIEFEEQSATSQAAMAFFRKIQLGFEAIEIHAEPLSPEFLSRLPEEVRKRAPEEELKTYSVHSILNASGEPEGKASFLFEKFESDGTQKAFTISGPIFDTLQRGATLVIDELDAKLHPLISREIVRLFVSPETNPLHAQLLFTTHDTNLLSSELLRDDQIWFAEKDHRQMTDIYRLTDVTLLDGSPLPRLRNHENNYIQGRYGAIPFIRLFD